MATPPWETNTASNSQPNASIWTIRNLDPVNPAELLASFQRLRSSLDAMDTSTLSMQPLRDARLQVRNQLLGIVALSSVKMRSLSGLVIHSIEQQDWLSYGMAGRSIIEHAAVLRYYLWEKIAPFLQTRQAQGSLPQEQLEEVRQILMQCIRGGRFDWTQVLEEWLNEPSPAALTSPQPSQVNILTTLQKWNKEDPRIEKLYAMFCDLVHPNLGSSLLVIGINADQISFGGKDADSLGRAIASGTGAALFAIADGFCQGIRQIAHAVQGWESVMET